MVAAVNVPFYYIFLLLSLISGMAVKLKIENKEKQEEKEAKNKPAMPQNSPFLLLS